MKPNIWKLSLCSLALCAAGMIASAAPLQRADITASPAWLLHLDCDSLRPTPIGQYILAEMDKPEAKAKLAVFQTIFSFDLRTQLHGVTLYGKTPAPEDAVLLVYADFDPDRLVLLAKAAKDFQTTRHHQHEIYSWLDDKKKARDGIQPRVYAAIQGDRVIFGQREEAVAGVLDVLDGSSPNLAGAKSFSELGAAGSTNFIEAGATKMILPAGDPNAAVLKLAKSLQLVIGEKLNQCQGRLTLVADSDEVAGHVLAITQGLVALVKLQNNPATVRLANAITISQDGSEVVGNLVLPLDDVVEMMKADAARKAARKDQP